MDQKSKVIQQQFEGFLKTPLLWLKNNVQSLEAFQMDSTVSSFDKAIDVRLRLGKYVERFVSYQLSQQSDIQLIAENIQIQQSKQTLGEIDFLVLQDEQPVHIETVYKFYLYDPQFSINELECWIGPNRKDSLVEKLAKLTTKQLPLLHSKACQEYLVSLGLTSGKVKQSVLFKAQLFLPYTTSNVTFQVLNKACVQGFYIYRNDRSKFKNCKFCIPTKKDWLVIPHVHVDWLSFEDFCTESDLYLERKLSPMCWMKLENGELHKFFLVWWKASET